MSSPAYSRLKSAWPTVPEERRALQRKRAIVNGVFAVFCAMAFVLVVVPLADILWTVFERGFNALSWSLFTQVTNGISGGLLNAIEGTLVLSGGAILFAAPIGVAAGIYLAEYGQGPWGKTARFLADVLVGVPSIVLGYFSYVTLVIGLGWQFSALAGAITLAVLIVPYVTRFTELAMRQNPSSLREAAYALGCKEHQVVFRVLLPAARSAVVTGILLSLAISVGETAPLIYTAGWSNYVWNGQLTHEPIGYLTYVIWSFINQPFASAHALAYAAAFLVIAMVLAINVAARILMRVRTGQ
ncbi:phosphate ABC transporter permease PstA [Pandoraea sp.]|uniref:phosphate ABC transporter permease PstA n=1 Tax=Pandoraea sp. TaxID=1883445 RepID=UPI0011F8BCED|nr:phosphate ABC transporter permease PstA [Pandoraea sp.]TAL52310.1 MAG: phosphate ABC transporter permease PstA [Pandoraea sp.]TAM16120.1 MAG: phosphate ABC transporter permease PstA [Pandoraea sp.]